MSLIQRSQIIHIVFEIVIVAGLALHFNNRLKKISVVNDTLLKRIDDIEHLLKHHDYLLNKHRVVVPVREKPLDINPVVLDDELEDELKELVEEEDELKELVEDEEDELKELVEDEEEKLFVNDINKPSFENIVLDFRLNKQAYSTDYNGPTLEEIPDSSSSHKFIRVLPTIPEEKIFT